MGTSNNVGASDLMRIGDVVGRTVLAAKGLAHPPLGEHEERRVSLREIASMIGVSHTAVNKAVAAVPTSAPLDGASQGPGRHYAYTLSDMCRLRTLLGRDRKRTAGERMVVVGITNYKGGVSKSTTAAHLAQHLGLHGYRTLVIDTDPQGTLSTLFGFNPDTELSVADTLVPYLAGKQPDLRYAIRRSAIPMIDVIPANVGLAQADQILPERQMRAVAAGESWRYMTSLHDGLQSLQDEYDVVVIDCPPSMSYLTTVATQACDGILIPLRPSMPDFASSAQFVRMFGELQANTDAVMGQDKHYAWVRVLITQGDAKSTAAEMEEVIRMAYADLVLRERFPYLAAVARAAKSMRTVFDVPRNEVDSRQLARATMIVEEMCQAIEVLIRNASTRAQKGERQ